MVRKLVFVLATLVIGIFVIYLSSFGEDRWVPIGPEGGTVSCLAIDPQSPNTVYAGTLDGVFKSMNGGASWLLAGLTNTHVYALAIDPQKPGTLYAGGEAGRGVFKSTDGGANWFHAALTGHIPVLAINPQEPNNLYAGTSLRISRGLVLKSVDGGMTWTVSYYSPPDDLIRALVVNPQVPETLYGGTKRTVIKTTDGGMNWANTGLILGNSSVYTLAINPQVPKILYAGTSRGVFKSIDGGMNWTAVNAGLANTDIRILAINPQAPETIYAGTNGGGVFKSANAGVNWTSINTGLTNTYISTLAINPQAPAILYAGSETGGVFKSQSETISAPSTPEGPRSGKTDTSYFYSTGGATSSISNSLEYQFDWKGDGSDLSGWGASSQSKAWSTAGTYRVKARARSATVTSAVSGWSSGFSVTISQERVSMPHTPSGPATCTTGRSCTYSTDGSTSSLVHAVEYQFDWKGDGSDLSAWGASTLSKTWSAAGTYSVRARGRCETDISAVSAWSSALFVTVSVPPVETISTPTVPAGTNSGNTGTSYSYTTGGSTSSLGLAVEYQFDWKGDGSDLSAYGSAAQSKTWTAAGTYNVRARARDTLNTSVVSNWSPSLSVAISSNAKVTIISVTPTAYDFGNVKVKKGKTAAFMVKNRGPVDLAISSLKIMGPHASMFAITSGSGGKTVKPGKSLSIQVVFKPTSKGAKSAKLEITSNDPVTPTLDVSLRGTGQQP